MHTRVTPFARGSGWPQSSQSVPKVHVLHFELARRRRAAVAAVDAAVVARERADVGLAPLAAVGAVGAERALRIVRARTAVVALAVARVAALVVAHARRRLARGLRRQRERERGRETHPYSGGRSARRRGPMYKYAKGSRSSPPEIVRLARLLVGGAFAPLARASRNCATVPRVLGLDE